jgi:hypothetical protein
MLLEVPLRCRCGRVRGVATHVGPETGTRSLCYCDDCQAFARFLGQPDVVDDRGGTDVYQMAIFRVSLAQGADDLRAMRLSPKGMIRFYAGCCRTPIGNTLGPRVPFIGLVHSFIDLGDARARDEILGKAVGVQGRFAPGGCPPGVSPRVPPIFLMRAVRNLAGWWLTGRRAPSPFYEPSGATRAPLIVLSADERAALRT